jgi:hypothetical protein
MGVGDALVGELQARATATAGHLVPLDISTLLSALVKMGVKPDAGFLEAMQGRAREVAGEFKPHEVENLLQAFSTMGITPDAGLVEAMPNRGGPQKGDGGWSTKEIMACTDARGLLALVKKDGLSFNAVQVVAAWGNVAKIPSAGAGGDEGAVLQLLQDLTRKKMQELRAREVANVAHTIAMLHESGRMGVHNELVGELQARAIATAGSFKPMGVARLMWALEKMGIKPDAGLVKAMQIQAMETAGEFKPAMVTSLLQAFATMGIRPGRGLLEAMQGRAKKLANDFNHEELENLMQAFATMGITPDMDLLEAIQGRADY